MKSINFDKNSSSTIDTDTSLCQNNVIIFTSDNNKKL